jgi:hypothetical protein
MQALDMKLDKAEVSPLRGDTGSKEDETNIADLPRIIFKK